MQSKEGGVVSNRYDEWYKDFRYFVDVIVPDVIEKQQGAIACNVDIVLTCKWATNNFQNLISRWSIMKYTG